MAEASGFLGNFVNYFRDHHTFEGIDHTTLIRWGCIILIWLLAACWHQHQNKAFHAYIKNAKARTPLNDRLSQLAYNRAFELLGLFFVLILALVFYDTRIHKADADNQVLQNHITALEQEITGYEEQVVTLQAAQAAKPVETQLPENIEQALDEIKNKYEKLFVSYYYLKRCNALTATEFHLMNSALIHELTQLNAPTGIRKRILEAAKGTHDELYAEATCDADVIDPKREEIDTYLQQVIDNLPDQ